MFQQGHAKNAAAANMIIEELRPFTLIQIMDTTTLNSNESELKGEKMS
jgi:hypothetical protein